MDDPSTASHQVHDGWLTATAEAAGMDRERLQTMATAIRSGAFVKITSDGSEGRC